MMRFGNTSYSILLTHRRPFRNIKCKHGAPFVDMAQLKLWKEIVVVAPLFLPRVGLQRHLHAHISAAALTSITHLAMNLTLEGKNK